jgi:hypothetical protein
VLLPWGSGSFFATSARRVHSLARLPRGVPTFRPRRFPRPRRFTPRCVFVGLFHPTATSKVRSSGASPCIQPDRLVADRFPHAVGSRSPAAELPRLRQIPSPRLQGVDPNAGPLCSTKCLAPPKPDPLLSFHSFGLSFARLGNAFTSPPLMTFSPRSACNRDAGLQRFNQRPTSRSVPRTTTRPSFFCLPCA